MRNLFIALLAVFCFSGLASANVYVIVNDKNEVLSAQNTDDAILQEGQVKRILKGTLSDYSLELPPIYYKLSGNKFVQNRDKIDFDEKVKQETETKSTEKDMILNRAMRDACVALVAGGIKLQQVKCEDFEK